MMNYLGMATCAAYYRRWVLAVFLESWALEDRDGLESMTQRTYY